MTTAIIRVKTVVALASADNNSSFTIQVALASNDDASLFIVGGVVGRSSSWLKSCWILELIVE
jgi:hypothetical protein